MTKNTTKEKDKAESSVSANSKLNKPVKPVKDFWDKLDIATKPIAAFLTAIMIAAIGYFSQSTLTELSLREQNARLYTELLARREDAESSLRKDMFKEIMNGFFASINPDDIEDGISKKILKLELLAYNFGDTMSLGPLFTELSNDIDRSLEIANIEDWKVIAGDFQRRLRSLAKRVASAQYSTIAPIGENLTFEAPFKKIELAPNSVASSDYQYNWPIDEACGELLEPAENSPDNANDMAAQYDDCRAMSDEMGILVLDDIKRKINISFRNADYEKQSVGVRLEIIEFEEEFDEESGSSYFIPNTLTPIEFTLDFFNFPLIDNTRLSNNQRFTLILKNF